MPTYFTLTEARALLSSVGRTIREAVQAKARYDEAEEYLHNLGQRILMQGGMAVALAMFTGPAASLVGEMFPPAVRSTGLSLSYNIAVPIFGGFAPYFVTRLDTGDHLAPAFYMMACAVPTLAALLWMRRAGSTSPAR